MLANQLTELGFEHVGGLSEVEVGAEPGKVRLRFQLHKHIASGPGVYVWTEKHAPRSNKRPLYIGKAGSSLRRRCSQHEKGFDGGSKRGLRHAVDIRDVLRRSSIEVWFRFSAMERFFGVEVSLAHVEEVALIERLNPLWNGRKVDAVSTTKD